MTFDAVEAERDRLREAALVIDQAWGEFVSSRSELSVIGEATGQEAGLDPVRSLLAEAGARLHRAQVEVVISGYLKRGKSTLINALLGVEVSSMRVTPETARPVYVNYGERRSWVIYPSPDGHGEAREDVDPGTAAAYGGYRPEEGGSEGDKRKPLRVEQQLPVDLLRSGVILKDTPGLDDANPQLAQELENLTLAELDRATATIMVLSCPPGLSGSELHILESLDARRVDKVFIVCNFHTDVWEDDDDRKAILDHVQRSITGTTAEGSRIFAVHAKRGWQARVAGDEAAYQASGVGPLEQELERYLASGVYQDVLQRTSSFLSAARDEVVRKCGERLDLLRDPDGLEARRREKQAVIDGAQTVLDAIATESAAQVLALGDEVLPVIRTPFQELASSVSLAGASAEVNNAGMRFDAQYEAALARVAVTIREELWAVEQRAKVRLIEAFGEAPKEQIDLFRRVDSFNFVHVSANLQYRAGPDWGNVWLGATLGALGGGALAGGAGLALLAVGPVGWLAGAALGFVIGGSLLLGSSSPGLKTSDRNSLLQQVERQRAEAEESLRGELNQAAYALESELRGRLKEFAADAFGELKAVESVVDDLRHRGKLESAAESVRARVSALRLG